MKPVSAAYRQSMQQTMRNRSYIRVTVFIENPTAAHDGQWTDNGAELYSSYDTLDFFFNYNDPTYATLELNRWALDGSQAILPAAKPADGYTEQGFVSNKISGGDGTFTAPAVLHRKFSVDHALHGLTLTFDSRCNTWPLEIMVRFMLAGEVVDIQTLQIKDVTAAITTEVDYIDELEITFTRCLPFHRPRVEYVLHGLQTVYTGDTVSSVTQKHDVDPLSRRLPAETAQVRLLDYNGDYDPDNPKGIFRYIEEDARLRIQHGYTVKANTVEWLRPDEYLSDGKPSTANHIATFTATGIISSLSDTFYKSRPGRKSLYDMAEEVLLDAGLTPTAAGGNPWKIDESLKEMFTDAMLPIDSHMNCLKLIAHAARSTLYTDDENIIHITPFTIAPRESDFVLNFDTITEGTLKTTKIEKLRAVTVTVYSYVRAENESKIYEATTNQTTLHVDFSSPAEDIVIDVSGGSLLSAEIYGQAADLELSAGTKTVTITGYALEQSSAILTYTNSPTGEVDAEDNPLITDYDMALALAKHFAAYLTMRNTYDAAYRGNPELETRDIIGVQTGFTDEMDALILVNEITYNGALSGRMKVKGLIQPEVFT